MKASYLLQLFTLEKTAAKLAAISKTLVTTFEQQINSGAQKVYCGNVNWCKYIHLNVIVCHNLSFIFLFLDGLMQSNCSPFCLWSRWTAKVKSQYWKVICKKYCYNFLNSVALESNALISQVSPNYTITVIMFTQITCLRT